MKINNFNIDVSDMPSVQTTRRIRVAGEIGAEFEIVVLEVGTLKYYNFLNKEFELGHNNLNNNLKIKLKNIRHESSIIFPSGGGDYVVKFTAINDTEIQNSKSNIITSNISKQATSIVVTFQPGTGTTTAANYATFPTTTSTGAVGSTASVSFDWDVTNASTDAKGFGLRLTGPYSEIVDKYWYFTTTDTVNGAITSSTEVVIDDLTDIGVGTTIAGVSGGSLSGTPTITAIDTATKTLTLSAAQTFADGITLTFKALGATNINAAIGLVLDFELYPTVTPTPLTKVTRATSASTTVNLVGTYGIAGGNHVNYLGAGVDNSSDNAVTEVNSVSSSAGSILVQNAQTLSAGTVLTFTGCNQVINFVGNIIINQFPTAAKTIYLDLDRLITVGAVS